MRNKDAMPNGRASGFQPAFCAAPFAASERFVAACSSARRPFALVAAACLLLAVLLTGALAAGAAHPATAYAAASAEAGRQSAASSAQNEETTLELYRHHAEAGAPFQVANMLPGDVETKSFVLRISYQGSVTVKFRADVRDAYAGLADVLKCRVSLGGGELLYDGLMRDMPAELNHVLPQSGGTTEELAYDVSAYLETSVDSAYVEKELLADFCWWVDSDVAGEDSGSNAGFDGSSQGSLILPATGDSVSTAVWTAGACVLLCALALVFYARGRKNAALSPEAAVPGGLPAVADGDVSSALFAAASPEASAASAGSGSGAEKTRKRLIASVGFALVLALCLCAATYALTTASESVPNNSFQTGSVKINLNDGRSVIQAQKFEPGMVVSREFFVENTGTVDAFCEVSFADVQGGLSDVLVVRIADGADVLFEGSPAELSAGAARAVRLAAGEKRFLAITLLYPEEAGSSSQGEELSFVLSARATQVKNNPNGLFG